MLQQISSRFKILSLHRISAVYTATQRAEAIERRKDAVRRNSEDGASAICCSKIRRSIQIPIRGLNHAREGESGTVHSFVSAPKGVVP